MARYDWLVDFGDVAPQIPLGIGSLLPQEGFTGILSAPSLLTTCLQEQVLGCERFNRLSPGCRSVLPTEVGGSRNTESIWAGRNIYLMLQFLLPFKWEVSLEEVT